MRGAFTPVPIELMMNCRRRGGERRERRNERDKKREGEMEKGRFFPAEREGDEKKTQSVCSVCLQ